VRSARLATPLLIAIAAVVALALSHREEIRARAEAGLVRGMPAREGALARGFVLGEDEEIDAATAEDFRRSGLSHLLAVSGQNVTLLALLAAPLLGALGIPLRERLVWLLGLIVVYVPVAGAGPSIQRAGVMGAAGLLATLGGRRASRLYALALAALVTLAIDPGVAADVGWQLSFAAVLGILALATPLRRAFAAALGRGPWRRALAEGLAVTVAATLATAPLIAFQFGTLSTTTLLANVLVLPAVAPAMWLGMGSAALSQVPGAPVEALNVPSALLLAYVAQIASWCAAPGWAEVEVRLGLGGLLLAYLGLAMLIALGFAIARGRRLALARRRPGAPSRRRSRGGPFIACAVALVALWASGARESQPGPVPGALRVEVLDVGQGDAILLRPAAAPAVLVDGGPPGDGLRSQLEEAGVERLGAVVLTHDQSDHAGGLRELLGELPVERFLYARIGRATLAAARAAGARTVRLSAGMEVRSGQLRLEALWPPPELLSTPSGGEDPNQLGIVLLVRWHRFRMLLTADVEAESASLDPGPIDVLKVAHHGSEDAGLAALLERSHPRLAVISVGEGNPYGHPAPSTLRTLAAHGVRTIRTDRDGPVVLDVGCHFTPRPCQHLDG
jgi:competence protein ComEC